MHNLIFLTVIILAIIVFSYIEYSIKENSIFEPGDLEVFFKRKNVSIPYSHIISLERDITFGGARVDMAYVIVYMVKDGVTDSFRIFKTMKNTAKWEYFESKLLKHNPSVIINHDV